MYVEELIGPETVNTLPPKTLAAFRDHGRARQTLQEGVEQAEADIAQLRELGIDLDAVTRKLQEDGVARFCRLVRQTAGCAERQAAEHRGLTSVRRTASVHQIKKGEAMELGMIGLGRMGGPMAQRLTRGGHRVVGLARNPDALRQLEEMNIAPAASFDELVNSLKPPRIVWLMIPAGAPVDENIAGLLPLLEPDDVIVDGGNSNYKDTQRRAQRLKANRIHYVDAGTSGGVWGLQNGYSIMVGGDEEVVARLRPIFRNPCSGCG